jgi:hypothetical protein
MPGEPTKARQLRLSDSDWAALDAIARHHGLDWGGIPNRAEAVRLLIAEELRRLKIEPK